MQAHANAEIYCALNDSIVPDGEYTYLKCNGFVAYRAGDEIRKEDEERVEEAWKRLPAEKAARSKRVAERALISEGLTPEAVKAEEHAKMGEIIAETVTKAVATMAPQLIAGTIAALKKAGVIETPSRSRKGKDKPQETGE